MNRHQTRQPAVQRTRFRSRRKRTMTNPSSVLFHKMHGAGNDFVLLDLRQQQLQMDAALASRLAHRRLGIGCDQLLLLHSPLHPGSAVRYEIRNTDGSAAGQCGNGARCIALYLQMNGEAGSGRLTLESPTGLVKVDCCADGEFQVDMGEPAFDPELIPISMNSREGSYHLDSPAGPLQFGAASMGNPHALLEVNDLASAAVETTGSWLGQHEIFPQGCNIGFVQVLTRDTIRLRVYERGTGETLACGSGACAAVAILRRAGRVDRLVNVFLPGGHLVIEWVGPGFGIRMKGPATHVFSGTVGHECKQSNT